MEGGWPDQTRRDDSRYSPSILQASWNVWDTLNSLIDMSREVGNTKNTTFYHFIDQKCGDSGAKASYNVPEVNKSYSWTIR